MFEPEEIPYKNIAKISGAPGALMVGGGIVLLALQAIGSIPFVGLVAGGALAVYGYTLLRSGAKRKSGQTLPGAVLTAAGIITAAAGLPIVKGLAGFLLGGAGIGLLAFGAWQLVRFFMAKSGR